MRNFQMPGRSTVHGLNAMVATSHPQASLAALDLLRAGGTAADAAVAAAAVLGVVEPMSTGIGGDCFVLYAPGGRTPLYGLNGSGAAPAGLNLAALQGAAHLAEDSPHTVTVPGAVAAWARLLADHGRLGLAAALAPAIRLAREGFAVSPRVALDWAHAATLLRRDEGARWHYLIAGEAPRAGTPMRLPALAATLERIAAEGPAGFYDGAVAADMVAALAQRGGVHTRADFLSVAPERVDPLMSAYRSRRIVELPPNGQGLVALIMLGILECFDLASLPPGGADRLHLIAEAQRLAYHARDRWLGDPRFATVPLDALLDKALAQRLAARISMDRALSDITWPDVERGRETVYLAVVDYARNACSFINSLFMPFGSGIVAPFSGVVLHNRGLGFSLKPGHPNALAPGKRPLHTIIPGLALDGERVAAAFGVMGGHFQPVGHAGVVTALYDHGLDPQAALDLARGYYSGDALVLEAGVPDAVAQALADRGHRVVRADEPLGGGQIILVDSARGTLTGASDGRKDGLALGF